MPPVTQTLLIANVAVYLLQQSAIGELLETWFALWPLGYGFAIWQLVTYGFLHGGIGRISRTWAACSGAGSRSSIAAGVFPSRAGAEGGLSSSPSSEARYRKDQKDSREQQQNQDDLAKTRFVEPSVESHPDPGAGQQHRQTQQKQLHRIGGDPPPPPPPPPRPPPPPPPYPPPHPPPPLLPP